jgi:hypothetical protein
MQENSAANAAVIANAATLSRMFRWRSSTEDNNYAQADRVWSERLVVGKVILALLTAIFERHSTALNSQHNRDRRAYARAI